MSGFTRVERVYVPVELAHSAHTHLQRVGQTGLEGFALWAGTLEERVFCVRETYIPVQQGWRSEAGVCVTVDGRELHHINLWLFQRGWTLIAQLHSHPTDAYHSETDDAFPIVTTVGGLSLVVPDFAQRPFSLADCAVYRLFPGPIWVALTPAEVTQLIVLEEEHDPCKFLR